MFCVVSSDRQFNFAASVAFSHAGMPVAGAPTLLVATLAKGFNASEIVARAAKKEQPSSELAKLFHSPHRPGLPIAPCDLLGSGDEGRLHILTTRAEGAIDALMQTDGVYEVRFVREPATPEFC